MSVNPNLPDHEGQLTEEKDANTNSSLNGPKEPNESDEKIDETKVPTKNNDISTNETKVPNDDNTTNVPNNDDIARDDDVVELPSTPNSSQKKDTDVFESFLKAWKENRGGPLPLNQLVQPPKDMEETSTQSRDVERFGGKIVYNPDGSAYIIDNSNNTGDNEDDPVLQPLIPRQEGSIIEDPGHEKPIVQGLGTNEASTDPPSYPQIANAFYVTRSAAYYNTLYGQRYASFLREKLALPETPVVYSYRVHSKRTETRLDPPEAPKPVMQCSAVPVKPILMCFFCKLSFGYTSSFVNHLVSEHNMEISEEEKKQLDTKSCSAILQAVGKDKSPLLSFLEPMVNKEEDPNLTPDAIKGLLSAALTQPNQKHVVSEQLPPTEMLSSQRLPVMPTFSKPDGKLDNSRSRNGFDILSGLTTTATSSSSTTNLLDSFNLQSMMRMDSIARKSPLGNNINSDSNSVSPNSPMAMPLPVSGSPGFPSNANMLQGTTIGACPDHVNGRQTGVECSKCDMILNSSRIPGGIGWNAARNTCKTLKCPKCNWHYKYQETLEIHMKEKHPESETNCIYCVTGQQHPRLARGETYTCGYKPYRCEVCNYSTTTKGNLSIHMQSDKHLNNMQELQNGTVVTTPDGTKLPQSPLGRPVMSPINLSALAKQAKPSWRCDVCNYETNVARNLRIHMTSEKHTHNIMVIQQNMKHLQQMSHGGNSSPSPGGPLPPNMFPPFPGLDPQQLLQLQLGLNQPGFPPIGSPGNGQVEKQGQSEAAMADVAYLQALMMQMVTGGQFPPGPQPGPDFNPRNAGGMSSPGMEGGMNPDGMEPPPEPADQNPSNLFNCCVCREFSCDNLDQLSQHLTADRTRNREYEISIVIAGNFICKLCSYKTNLKANFQLHCKTDKHLQRLNHVNHIKEGGPANEWRIKFLNVTNPVQLRCNACDYYTNSLHKLQLHVANQRHEISTILFAHLLKSEQSIPEEGRAYHCSLCNFSGPGKLSLMAHVRSMKHLQMEQLHQIQKRSQGTAEHTEIGDIFQVITKKSDADQESSNQEDGSQEGSKLEDGTNQRPDQYHSNEENQEKSPDQKDAADMTPCPLCQEPFSEYSVLESHVMQIHSVNSEGLKRLLMLMEGSHWLNNSRTNFKGQDDQPAEQQKDDSTIQDTSAEESSSEQNPRSSTPLRAGNEGQYFNEKSSRSSPALIDPKPVSMGRKLDKGLNYPLEKYLDPNRPHKCDVCKESFTQKNILLVHYNSVSHLHKLKKSMQDQNKRPNPKSNTLENALNNIVNAKQIKDDDEVKPYKCNICKVAYNQGSTLDIHIRSVLHQNRASKLQELAISGQVDLSKPLIEQPNDNKGLEEQQQKILQGMLSPKSLNSSGSSIPQTSPTLPGQSPSTSPLNSSLLNLKQALFNNKMNQIGKDLQSNQLLQILQAIPTTSNALMVHQMLELSMLWKAMAWNWPSNSLMLKRKKTVMKKIPNL